MLFKAFKWRLDEDIPAVKYSSDAELNQKNDKFFEQLESGKFYIHGTDKENRIVAYVLHLSRKRGVCVGPPSFLTLSPFLSVSPVCSN